jgi:membrane peptidoglycan carboxypeptidase
MKQPLRRATSSTTRRVRNARSSSPVNRFLNRFKPANLRAYWFSRDGAIMAAKIMGAGLLVIMLIFLYVAKDLPNPSRVKSVTGAQNTRYYARDGETLLWEDHGDKNRTVIPFDQMPANIKNATIAIEDKNFYKQGSFSVVGYLRAAIYDITHRGAHQGGSTITQQYVKNALLSNETTFTRKIKELILAIEIGQLYKKDDILKLYLNEIPYGSQSYGIQAAAKTFFNKNAKDLTLPESALLAAMANAPTYFSPYGDNQEDLIARQHLVLDKMAEQGYITKAEATAAKKVNILGEGELSQTPNLSAGNKAPQFNLYAKGVLAKDFGTATVESGGLKVITTLDYTKQQQAEEAVRANMGSIRRAGGSNAALVSADPKTGQIYAMVGSHDFSKTQVNVALASRQPGSSFKPFVYATAWGKNYNYGPGTTMYDVTTDFGGNYIPKNYDGLSHGVQSMRTSLGNSFNIPAVKALYMVGIDNAIDTAHKLGISTLYNPPTGGYGLPLVLGSGEVKLNDMVNAYESFSNGGLHYKATPILKVYNANGKVIKDNTKPSGKQVLDPQVAYLMSSVLSDNSARAVSFGSNSPLVLPGYTAAVKTGTTTNYHDAWTVGYTPTLIAGVWVGNNDNSPMTEGGVNIAAPIWNNYMRTALKGTPNEAFNRPSGIQTITLDADTGRLPTTSTKRTRTDIFASWYKPPTSTSSRSAKIDKVSGKLATDCTPDTAIETAYSSEIHAEIPYTDPAYARWEPPVAGLAASLGYAKGGSLPSEKDDVHNCSDVKPNVSISVTGTGPIRITATVTAGTFPATQLDIKLDDQVISTQSPILNNPYSFDYTAASPGSHTISATVIDKGLYQASDQTTVVVTNTVSESGFVGTNPPNGSHQVGNAAFTWTAVDNTTQYQLFVTRNGAPYAPANPLSTSGTAALVVITPGIYTWRVEAYNGPTKLDSTPTYNFISP